LNVNVDRDQISSKQTTDSYSLLYIASGRIEKETFQKRMMSLEELYNFIIIALADLAAQEAPTTSNVYNRHSSRRPTLSGAVLINTVIIGPTLLIDSFVTVAARNFSRVRRGTDPT
jgi:hypothetical protein